MSGRPGISITASATTAAATSRVGGVKLLIEAALADGNEVSVLVATPGTSEWNGLPVDLVAGLESGLIRTMQPAWNKSSLQ